MSNTATAPSDPLKTDRNVYPEPPPPTPPAAGGNFVDPVFGTTILRVTDERDGTNCRNSYSYWPSLNRNNTRLLVFCNEQPTLYDFDSANFKASNKRAVLNPTPALGGALRTEDATWSGTDQDVIYCHAGPRIFAYNVQNSAYSLVKDFTGKLAAANIEQISRSADDRVFAFTMKDANWKVIGYAAWDRSSDKVYPFQTTQLDEVQIDKSGQFLLVGTGVQGAQSVIEGRVFSLQTGQFVDLTDGAPDFFPGHHDCGSGILVGADETYSNDINARRFDDPHRFTVVLPFGNDWGLGKHLSMLADGDEWLLVSTFLVNPNLTKGLFKNELFLVATDGSQRVRRVCHHHSTWREYWDTPRADISRDGQFAVFTSNQGSATRRDVFVVRIPPVSQAVPPPSPPPTLGLSAQLRDIADKYDRGLIR